MNTDMLNKTPKEIMRYLDEYIIGQEEAKKSIAVALRNRYRRLQLPKEMREEVTPKNILMIGSTGVGKTEIARRMAKIMGLPFVKVEASKYTEVGFVGRDVESIIRDLASASYNLVQKNHKEKSKQNIDEYVINKIAQKLIPPLPSGSTDAKKKDYEISIEKIKEKINNGSLDETKISIEVSKGIEEADEHLPTGFIKLQESLMKAVNFNQKQKKEVSIKDAKEMLRHEAQESILDAEQMKQEALDLAEKSGIVFIDEIDKVASSENSKQDPSKGGVQRDLLPIVEGSVVNTRYGQIKTDHILFIAAGAFHFNKPSDLIPELQGRFPIRVELETLDEEMLYKILTSTKNSIIKQNQALLRVDNITLEFQDDALKALSRLSYLANEKTEDIGARRLHTTMEKILEDISFDIEKYQNQKVIIDKEMIENKLAKLIDDEDKARYIL